MHILIFAGGTLHPGKAIHTAIASADLIIAADSGAATALQHGCPPAIIVGDFDSLDPQTLQQLNQQGSQVRRVPLEKNETDTELAIQVAIEQGASRISLLGALGGPRFEHAIANILLLAAFPHLSLHIIDGPSTCWLLHGPGQTTISGETGDLLSLLPLSGDAIGIHTNNLYYPLHNETLHFGTPRGISNVLTQPQAEVSLEHGLLLVIHTNNHELANP